MSFCRTAVVVAAAALAGAAAGGAHAADASRRLDFTVRTEATTPALGPGKTVRWDASKGRFGITLNMKELEARPSSLSDVEAGAYYRITPSLRVGGSVAFGEKDPVVRARKSLAPGAKDGPAEDQPRVRLQTEFKF